MNTLVLLHGAIGAKDQFATLISRLQLQQPIVALTLAGHGELAGEEGSDFGIEAFAQQLLDWMNENSLAQIDIFGYSMGGYVALWLALHHPEKVGRIMTLATKFSWSEEIAERETKMLDSEKIATKVPAFAQQLANRHGELNWKKVLQKTVEMMRSLGQKPLLTSVTMTTIEHEVLLAIGDRDSMVTLDETVEAYKSIKNGSLLVLPKTNHPIEKVDLDRLCNEIKLFFAS